jgi:hypothetical protein
MAAGSLIPDPLVMDERWVAANVKDKGIVVCSRPARMVPPAKLGFSGTAFHVWRLDTPSDPPHNPIWNCTEGPMDRQERGSGDCCNCLGSDSACFLANMVKLYRDHDTG